MAFGTRSSSRRCRRCGSRSLLHAAREAPARARAARAARAQESRRRRSTPETLRGDARARGAPARRRWSGTGSGHERTRAARPLAAGARRATPSRALGCGRVGRAGRATAPSASSTTARRATERNVRRRRRSDDSQLTVPDWINEVHELFPRRVVERLEQRRPRPLPAARDGHRTRTCSQRATPSQTLLKAVLHDQAPDEPEVLAEARADLGASSRSCWRSWPARSARRSPARWTGGGDRATGSRRTSTRRRRSAATCAHYDPEPARLFIRDAVLLLARPAARRPLADDRARGRVGQHGRQRHPRGGHGRDLLRHAAARRTSAVFDTNVVDVTDTAADPVETLMKVQLGGGTDIGKRAALRPRAGREPATARSSS